MCSSIKPRFCSGCCCTRGKGSRRSSRQRRRSCSSKPLAFRVISSSTRASRSEVTERVDGSSTVMGWRQGAVGCRWGESPSNGGETFSIHEGLQDPDGLPIFGFPIPADLPTDQTQNGAGQERHSSPRQDHESGVVDDSGQLGCDTPGNGSDPDRPPTARDFLDSPPGSPPASAAESTVPRRIRSGWDPRPVRARLGPGPNASVISSGARAHLGVVFGARVSTRRDVESGRTPVPIPGLVRPTTPLRTEVRAPLQRGARVSTRRDVESGRTPLPIPGPVPPTTQRCAPIEPASRIGIEVTEGP